MSRKLFSLIACLVLVLGFGVVPGVAQGEEGGTISGTVYEDDGVTPIFGVHVVACSDGDNEICYGADSDGSGNYTIAGLPLDTTKYRVFVWGQPGWSNEFWEETIWWHLATLVQAGATSIDFTLLPAGTISGTVTDADGNPLVNMGVDIADGGYGVCTDEDGHYTIVGLPLGTYDIVAGRDFCGPSSYVEQVVQAVTIDKDTPNVSGYNFALELGGSISGAVTDENGNPLSSDENIDISVCLFDDDSVCWWADVEDGSYLVDGLPYGDYRVHAYQYPEGFWIDEYYKNTSVWEDAQPVKIKPINGKNKKDKHFNVTGIDFTLELGGSISGTVTAIGGRLIEDNIDVSACFEDESFCGWASVQSDGTYVITGLPAGEYRVHAYQWPGGYWIDEVYKETRDWDKYTPVPVTAGGETFDINFTLEYGGAITGIVTDGDGNGIEGLWVSAGKSDFFNWALTDANGEYRIMALQPGEYDVFVSQQDDWVEQHYITPVSVNAGQDTDGINFALEPGGSISGIVTDIDGNHIPERIDVAACWFTAPEYCFWTTVQSDDTYTIIGLPAGEFYVNTYEAPEDGVPWGNWIGETYPTTIVLGTDQDIAGINFMLAKEE